MLQRPPDRGLAAIGLGQRDHPAGGLLLRRVGRGDVRQAAVEGVGQGDLGPGPQIERGGHVVEAGVAPHAAGDRQGLGVGLPRPQHHRVEALLVQIVEGGVGGQRRRRLGPEGGEGVGQGQELGRRLAHGQDLERRLGDDRARQGAAAVGEGGAAEFELLFGYRSADQGLQAQGRLQRVQGRAERQVEGAAAPLRVRPAERHHRQAARAALRPQPPGQRERGLVPFVPLHQHRLDRQVRQGGQGGVAVAGGDRAPAQPVESLGQGRRQPVVGRDDQDPGVHATSPVIASPPTSRRTIAGRVARREGA